MGRPRPAGRLGFSDDHADGAAARAGRQAGVDGRGSSRVRGRAQPPPEPGSRGSGEGRGHLSAGVGGRGRAVQRVLVRPGLVAGRWSPNVAHRRSAQRTDPAARAGRRAAGAHHKHRRSWRTSRPLPQRRHRRGRAGRPGTRRALSGRLQRRAADDSERLQQHAAGAADAGPRGHPERDDPRSPHRAARPPAASRAVDPAMDGRFPRALGGRHPGGRDNKFHGQDSELQPDNSKRGGHGGHAATRGAVHADRGRHAALRVHGPRPRHVHAAVQRRDPHGDRRRTALRVRLPRGQLRHVQPAVGCARAGGAGGDDDFKAAPGRDGCAAARGAWLAGSDVSRSVTAMGPVRAERPNRSPSTCRMRCSTTLPGAWAARVFRTS